MTGPAKLAEVGFGEACEDPILLQWAEFSPSAADIRGYLKAGQYDDFDFVIFGKSGLVVCYLEIKQRRIKFGQYGDVMFPLRKHKLALDLKRKEVLFLAVTRYACGTVIEVDLSAIPTKKADVTRRDRPGETKPHVFYSGRKLRQLVGPA